MTVRYVFSLAILLVVHVVSLIVLYYDYIGLRKSLLLLFMGQPGFVMAFGFIPLLVLAFAFGLLVQSWRQFGFWVLVVILAWQLEFLLLDLLVGRLTDPFWLEENWLRYAREIIARFAFPTGLLCVGALVGLLQRKYRFTQRHA